MAKVVPLLMVFIFGIIVFPPEAETACVDTMIWCRMYTKWCNETWFSAVCRRTCTGCVYTDECKDKFAGCKFFSKYCAHPVFGEKVREGCKHTCNVCGHGGIFIRTNSGSSLNGLNRLLASEIIQG